MTGLNRMVVTAGTCLSSGSGTRRHSLAVDFPPTVELGKACDDFRQQIRKRQEHPIWFGRQKFIGWHDWNIGPRHSPALLGGRGVGNRRKQPCLEAGTAKERDCP